MSLDDDDDDGDAYNEENYEVHETIDDCDNFLITQYFEEAQGYG